MRLYQSSKFRLIPVFTTIIMVACLILPAGAALADPAFVNNQFQAKWQRADKPVQDGSSKPSRSWLWGPEGFNQTGSTTESYADSPGGTRQVQYFDKARMELNSPTVAQPTNGLLVIEMISGREATGDTAFITRKPADIPVAGDATNNDGPTYASLAGVASLNLDKPATDKTGQTVVDTLGKDGKVGAPVTKPELVGKAKNVYFEPTLKHNIPDVFWNFLNQKGNVYQEGKLVEGQPILGLDPIQPWLDATGYPLTEAYWTSVTVGGVGKAVLVQAFQRRVLTYTFDNPAQYQVEMGNVGRHYFTWRYSTAYDIPVTPPITTPPPPTTTATPANPTVKGCSDLPASTANTYYHCGPAGMQVVLATQLSANEAATITTTGPDGSTQPEIKTSANKLGELKVYLDTLTGYAHGMWTYKAKGANGKEVVLYIWVDPPVTKPTIILTSPNPARKSDDNYFLIVGFPPNDPVNLNLRCPCGPSADTYEHLKTGAGGGLADTIKIDRDVNPAQFRDIGEWFYSARSVDKPDIFATVTFTIKD